MSACVAGGGSALRILREGDLGALIELHRDEHGLRLAAAGEHDRLLEQAHLCDEVGQVRAGVGDAQGANGGLFHALRVHGSRQVHLHELYNETVINTAGGTLDDCTSKKGANV